MKKQLGSICLILMVLGPLGAAGQQRAQAERNSEVLVISPDNPMLQLITAQASSVSVRMEELVGIQQGQGNRQQYAVTGTNNQVHTLQDGNFNQIDLQLTGDGNRYQFVQQGNENLLQLQNVQANNNTLQIHQRGNQNQLIDQGSGLMNMPIRIEQTGGMKLIINGQ
jgi:hypothetical protein